MAGRRAIKMKSKLILAIIAALVITVGVGVSLAIAGSAGPNEPKGVTFSMTMESPGRDPVLFSGAALGGDMKLVAKIGGIETVNLLTGGSLYILTPAIRTAREVENPDPPARDSGEWPEWLIEPGRVSPLTFAEVLGEDGEVDGQVRFGAGTRVDARFDHGRLVQLRFPSPSGEGSVVYIYGDFEEDADLASEDFQVPSGYKITE